MTRCRNVLPAFQVRSAKLRGVQLFRCLHTEKAGMKSLPFLCFALPAAGIVGKPDLYYPIRGVEGENARRVVSAVKTRRRVRGRSRDMTVLTRPKGCSATERLRVMCPDIWGPGMRVPGSKERFITGYVPVGHHIIRVIRTIAFGFLRRASKSIQTSTWSNQKWVLRPRIRLPPVTNGQPGT